MSAQGKKAERGEMTDSVTQGCWVQLWVLLCVSCQEGILKITTFTAVSGRERSSKGNRGRTGIKRIRKEHIKEVEEGNVLRIQNRYELVSLWADRGT